MFELVISYTIFDMATSNLNKMIIYNMGSSRGLVGSVLAY